MIKVRLSTKIMLIMPIAIVGMSLIFGTTLWKDYKNEANNQKILHSQKLAENVDQINIDFLQSRRREKDFILRNDPKYIKTMAEIATVTRTDINYLTSNMTGDLSELKEKAVFVQDQFEVYSQTFNNLADIKAKLGFDHESGLQGDLRKAAHKLEEQFKSLNAEKLTIALLMMRRHEKDFMLRNDIKYLDKLHGVAETIEATTSSDFGGDEHKASALKILDEYRKTIDAFADATSKSQKLTEDLSAAFKPLEPVFEEITAFISNHKATVIKDSDDASAFFKMIGVIIALVTTTCVGFIVFMISRSVSGSLTMSVRSMTQLARGDVNTLISGLNRTDEIGDMAQAVEVFRQTALAKIETDRQIEANRSQLEKNQIEEAQKDRARAEAMVKATTDLAAGLKRLSTGDLSVQLDEQFDTDFESLRQDFNNSVAQLSSTLSSVSQSVIAISNGSYEIANGANDLSKRTEQQAAALEQTAAALDEITANVTSSSRRVEDARQVAAMANDSATKSGDVVASAVNAMSRIESSSRQISNIIGVIDEIAFQTNLLALNAGVEAARAGDAGRGFAVVAQEVRELAQRSAGAAKEIKGLIQASSSEVATGVKLVSETGEVLKSIGEYIVHINQHMESIAVASKEQSIGLSEVNSAMNQMDQTTQQNAAMVEESSAAAATLTSETSQLKNLVEQFTLVQSTNQVKALRMTANRMGATNSVAGITKSLASQGARSAAQEWDKF